MQIFCFKNLFFGKYLFKRELYINNGTLRKFRFKMVNFVSQSLNVWIQFGCAHCAVRTIHEISSKTPQQGNYNLFGCTGLPAGLSGFQQEYPISDSFPDLNSRIPTMASRIPYHISKKGGYQARYVTGIPRYPAKSVSSAF